MTRTIKTGILLAVWALLGCAADVEDHIARLQEGGEGVEDAKMALSLARQDAIDPLLTAFADTRNTAIGRAHMADALYRLYIREKEPRILEALMGALDDDEIDVRRSVVRVLGDLGSDKGVAALVARLDAESDDRVRQEILVGLGLISLRQQTGFGFLKWSIEVMDLELRTPFVETLTRLRDEAVSDSLRANVLEWLEVVAEAGIQEARERELAADLAGAEQLFTDALELVPDSKNVNQRLGKFYFESGEREKGLELLQGIGAAIRVPRLYRPPEIDGVIASGEWDQATRIDRFYQNIARMRAFTVEGRSEAWIGYRGDVLYIGVEGYEPQTDNLEVSAKQRDENTWQDDCVELFFDPDRDMRTFYQIVINSPGVIFDQYSDGSGPAGDQSWNGEFEHATHVAADRWSLEIAIPMAQFGEGEVGPGAVWGANLARIRIANASEYGQWAPTYGSALQPDRFGYLIFE